MCLKILLFNTSPMKFIGKLLQGFYQIPICVSCLFPYFFLCSNKNKNGNERESNLFWEKNKKYLNEEALWAFSIFVLVEKSQIKTENILKRVLYMLFSVKKFIITSWYRRIFRNMLAHVSRHRESKIAKISSVL